MIFFNMAQYMTKEFKATVIVTCPSGTKTCTLKKTGSTATLVSTSGTKYTFSVSGDAAKGEWTATASNGSKTTTGTVTVSTADGTHKLTLPAYPVDPVTTGVRITSSSAQICWVESQTHYITGSGYVSDEFTVNGTYELAIPADTYYLHNDTQGTFKQFSVTSGSMTTISAMV